MAGTINELGDHPLLDDHRVHVSSLVETIGGDESSCTYLTSVTIPSLVETIGGGDLYIYATSTCTPAGLSKMGDLSISSRQPLHLCQSQCRERNAWLWFGDARGVMSRGCGCDVTVSSTAWPPSAPQAASVRTCPAARSCSACLPALLAAEGRQSTGAARAAGSGSHVRPCVPWCGVDPSGSGCLQQCDSSGSNSRCGSGCCMKHLHVCLHIHHLMYMHVHVYLHT